MYAVRERRHNGKLIELDIVDPDGRIARGCHPHFRPEHRDQAAEMAEALAELPAGYLLQWTAKQVLPGDVPGWSVASSRPGTAPWRSRGHSTAAAAIAAIADHTPAPWSPPPTNPNACRYCGLPMRGGQCQECV
ncbi:hypothetical protein ACIBTV_27690 [Micromonospora sp. NPDC049366]|uniref:hypothetical protein n=1 Tax=Micromonospora sp. NPDC049366 TaxID=3364271 RepID=UPI003797A3AA